MRVIRCKSGISGWQSKLRKVYASFAEFESFSSIYGLHLRLGYKTPQSAWKVNPTVQGSVNPMDYQKVRAKKRR